MTMRCRRPRCTGFTLVELLVVLMIAGILFAITLGAATYARGKARESKARSEIERLHGEIQEYTMEYGCLPTNLNQMAGSLSGRFSTDGDGLPLDPWRRPYRYLPDGTRTYRLLSLGPDDTSDADDIVSGG